MITPFGELPDRLAKRMSLQEQHEWLNREVPRRSVLAGIALGASTLVAPDLWRQSDRAQGAVPVSGRHITYGVDPTASMVVEFTTPSDFQQAHVRARAGRQDAVSAEVTVQRVRGSNRRYCRAVLTGLKPGTAYNYEVDVDGQTSSRGSFGTAPAQPHSFRFTAFGDQGTGVDSQRMLARIGALDPALHLMCGDLCYADSRGLGGVGDRFQPKQWDRWLEQNDPVAGRIPWLSVPGNHEMEPGFGNHGYAGFLGRVCPGGRSPIAVPVATETRVGNVGFVGLDSNDVSYEIPANRGWTGNAQSRWLEQTLSNMRSSGSGIDFIVAFLHHAPYSTNNTHASEGGVRESWVPLFDRYCVDLAISGHNHCYERARPLRGGKVVGDSSTEVDSSTATTYITAGGGGEGGEAKFIPYANKTRVSVAGGLEVVSEDWSLPSKTARPAVLSVDVTPSLAGARPRMVVRAISAEGAEIDKVVLSRPVRPSASAAPWLIGGATGLAAAAGGAAFAIQRRRVAPAPELVIDERSSP